MLGDLDASRRGRVEPPVKLLAANAQCTDAGAKPATENRSLTTLARRNGEWLRDCRAYWLAAAEESVTSADRTLYLQRAHRFANLIRANEECLRKFEQEGQ